MKKGTHLLWLSWMLTALAGSATADEGEDPPALADWTWIAHINGGYRSAEAQDHDLKIAASYDKDGYVTEFWPAGRDNPYSLRFTYDKNHRLTAIEKGFLNSESHKWEPFAKDAYIYTSSGVLTGIQSTDQELRKCTVDSRGNYVFVDTVGEDQGVKSIFTKIYNPQLALLEDSFTSQDADGQKTLGFKITHTYDAKGNRVKTVAFEHGLGEEKDKTGTMTMAFTFDKLGNKLKMTVAKDFTEEKFSGPTYQLSDTIFTYSAQENPPVASNPPPRPPKDQPPPPQAGGEKVKVLWDGAWYDATVLKRDGNKIYVHYEGYGPEWDEWVGPDRIKK